MKNIITQKRGSALVMSLLFMTILIVLSFSVNYMLLSEVRSERDFLSSVNAYYSAESGAEAALMNLSFEDKGSEPESMLEPYNFVTESGQGSSNLAYAYQVTATTNEYSPCVFERNDSDFSTFSKLTAGESVIIPLNKVLDSNGNDITKFQVDYFVVNTTSPYDSVNFVTEQKDILRWKIIGNRTTTVQTIGANPVVGGSQKVEAISDFLPIQSIAHNTEVNPSQFGTSAVIDVARRQGKYYDIIDGAEFSAQDLLYLFAEDETYLDSLNLQGGFHYIYHPQYFISDFLANHDNNMLVLTPILNVLDPIDPEITSDQHDNYVLYYRVHDGEEAGSEAAQEVACSAALISVDGYANDSSIVQSLDIVKPLDEGIAVTDFVWYQRD